MLSNSKGQDLVLHSIAVGMLAVKIFENNYQGLWNSVIESITPDAGNKTYNLEMYKKVLFNTGVYHDVGKLDTNFQNYLIKNMSSANEYDVQIEDLKIIDINTYPLHHEISWAFLNLQDTIFRNYHSDLFLYSIYWHHAKLIRKSKDFEKVGEIINNISLDLNLLNNNFKEFNKKAQEILEETSSLKKLAISECLENNELKETINSRDKSIPLFQAVIFDNNTAEEISLLKNAINHLTRAILISADRYISKLSKEELEDLFDTIDIDNSVLFNEMAKSVINIEEYEIIEAVDLMKERFLAKSNNLLESIQRNQAQEQTVDSLSQKGKITILQGPAGVGKTKMMLEWLGKINNKKKTYIIAPKTNIVNELYNELIKNYLPQIPIEKITGTDKVRNINGKESIIEDNNYFQSTINITTIDQLMSLMMSHDKIDVYLDVLNSNLIFDEFHEFMDTPALLMLFIQTITLKKMSKEGRCLLVSATPNPFLIEKLNLSMKNDLVCIKTFNKTNYQINNISFIDTEKSTEVNNPMFSPQPAGMICIFNTATKSQVSSIKAAKLGELNTITYHSKFYSKDRNVVFQKIIKEFGKGNTRNAVLRSGPILQASIDISTDHMQTEISTIDNIYQRLGRVVRWGDSPKGIGIYDIIIPANYNRRNLSITRSLSRNGQYEIVEEFIDLLNNNVFNKPHIDLNSLYNLYFDFFNLQKTKTAYTENWNYLKSESKKIFQQGFEPVKIYVKKEKKKEEKVSAKKSLRGNSIFGFAMTLESDGINETINQITQDTLPETFTIEKRFSFDEQEETRIVNELKSQIDNNFTKRKYLDSVRESYLSKIKFNKPKKKIEDVPNKRIIDYARYENTPIIFSYIDKTALTDNELRYNLIYKGLKIGIINYKKFKDVA